MNNWPVEDRPLYPPQPPSFTTSSPLVTVVVGAFIATGLFFCFSRPDALPYLASLGLRILSDMIQSASSLCRSATLGDLKRPNNEGSYDEQQPSAEPSSHSGNLVQTVFGLSSQVLKKGVQGVGSSFTRSAAMVPPGLGNWDNSCFQNSVVQGLASLPSLRDYLENTTREHPELDKETTNGALLGMISNLNSPENYGRHFWIPHKLRTMNTFQQQDAQEYYSKVLDELDKEAKKILEIQRQAEAASLFGSPPEAYHNEKCRTEETEPSADSSSGPAKLVNPLDGLLAQRVGCTDCGYTEGLSMIPFNCLTVPLGGDSTYDIRECLDEFTQMDVIEGVECAKCTLLRNKLTITKMLETAGPGMAPVVRSSVESRLAAVQEALDEENFTDSVLIKDCNILKKNWTKAKKSRQAVVGRAPKALVIHINRSVFDEWSGAQLKNHARVFFPMNLDLGPWCLGRRPSGSEEHDESVEGWQKDPNRSMLDSGTASSLESQFQYTLRAVIAHHGRHENGHYICFRRVPVAKTEISKHGSDNQKLDNQPQERWWRLSDDDVDPVPEELVLGQHGVFMLFYERVDEHQPTLAATETALVEEAAMSVFEEIPLPWGHGTSVAPIEPEALDIPLPEEEEDDLVSPPRPPVLAIDEPPPPSDVSKDDPAPLLELSAEPLLPAGSMGGDEPDVDPFSLASSAEDYPSPPSSPEYPAQLHEGDTSPTSVGEYSPLTTSTNGASSPLSLARGYPSPPSSPENQTSPALAAENQSSLPSLPDEVPSLSLSSSLPDASLPPSESPSEDDAESESRPEPQPPSDSHPEPEPVVRREHAMKAPGPSPAPHSPRRMRTANQNPTNENRRQKSLPIVAPL